MPLALSALKANREPSGDKANVWRLLPASRAYPTGGETLNRTVGPRGFPHGSTPAKYAASRPLAAAAPMSQNNDRLFGANPTPVDNGVGVGTLRAEENVSGAPHDHNGL